MHLFKNRYFYLILIFVIGFTSLIYEIYSVKVLFLFFVETGYAAAIAISAFLAGLAFSSLIFSHLTGKENRNNKEIIFWMQIAVAVYGFFILRRYDLIPQFIDYIRTSSVVLNPIPHALYPSVFLWFYLFIPAFFIGGSFPLVNGLYLASKEQGAHDTGVVYFWDTIGSVVGALIAGFWFLPRFGFIATAVITAFINLAIAFIIAPKKYLRIIVLILIALFIFLFHQTTRTFDNKSSLFEVNSRILDYPELNKRFGTVIFQKISPFGKITVGAFDKAQKSKGLFINYRGQCFSADTKFQEQIGELAVQKLPSQSRVANIGMGCGFTAGAMAVSPNIEKLDAVEINPVIAEAAEKYFGEWNQNVLHSPKTTLRVEDGAEFIRSSDDNLYGAIAITIENPQIVYSSPIYTKEYFEIIKNKLKPDGVLTLWTPDVNIKFEKVLYNTLAAVFANVNYKLINGSVVFYSSAGLRHAEAGYGLAEAGETNLPAMSEDEKGRFAVFKSFSLKEINTLDNMILGKYFNIRGAFDLPSDYYEKYIKD